MQLIAGSGWDLQQVPGYGKWAREVAGGGGRCKISQAPRSYNPWMKVLSSGCVWVGPPCRLFTKQTQDLNPVNANTRRTCDEYLLFGGGQIPIVDGGVLNLAIPGVAQP